MNLVNKYKLIKEKYGIGSSKNCKQDKINNTNSNSSKLSENTRERFANLEIRNKQNEETILALKNKLIEKDEVIKSLQESEEKLNKALKKIKDENIMLNMKIKELTEKLVKYEVLSNPNSNSGFNNNNPNINHNNNYKDNKRNDDNPDRNKNNEKIIVPISSANKLTTNANFENNSSLLSSNITYKQNENSGYIGNNINNPNANINVNVNNNNNNKKIKNKLNKKPTSATIKKFEITKNMIDQFTQNEIINEIVEYDIGKNYNSLINKISAFSNKDFHLLSNLLIGFLLNPINLFKEFPLSLIILAGKISLLIMKLNYKEVSISFDTLNVPGSNKNLNKNFNCESEGLNFLKEIFNEECSNYQEVSRFISETIKTNQANSNNNQEELIDLQCSNFLLSNNSNLNVISNMGNSNQNSNNNYTATMLAFNPLFSLEFKYKQEKKENSNQENLSNINNLQQPNFDYSSNNSLAINYFDSINNNINQNNNSNESVSLNQILIKKIKYFIANYFEKKEKKFIEKKNFILLKFSKLALLLFELDLSSNANNLLNLIIKIFEDYIFSKDNIMINFLFKNFFLEKILIIIRTLNCKRAELINNFCKSFIEIFLFLWSNNYLNINTHSEYLTSKLLGSNCFGNSPNKYEDGNISKVLRVFICENENFCNFLRNQIVIISNMNISDSRISDSYKKIIIFISHLKTLFPDDMNSILNNQQSNINSNRNNKNKLNNNNNNYETNESFLNILKDKISKKVDLLNNSILNEISDSKSEAAENILNLIDDNILNIVI